MSSNITLAVFGSARRAETKPLYQYDYGQILQITGVALPTAYEVHFGNTAEGGTTKTSIGDADGVVIPDEYLTSGADVYAFVYLHAGEDDGETEYVIHIPVRKRPEPSDAPPTPEQQGVITETIALLNATVEAFDARADEIEEEIAEHGGVPGKDGVSPAVTINTYPIGTEVKITDADHPTGQSFLVQNGRNGADGFSPTVAVSEISGGHRLTITTSTGVNTVDVMDGFTPVRGTLTLPASWTAGTGVYTQPVGILGATANSQVDLCYDADVIAQMVSDEVPALYIENNAGVLNAVCVGNALTSSVTVQYMMTETEAAS